MIAFKENLYEQTVRENIKLKKQVEELESNNYEQNNIINNYIETINKLKNKMIGDKMEQFDDYVIYLIESYLNILEREDKQC